MPVAGSRGRPYNRAISTAQKWATKLHTVVYRMSGGRIGGRMSNSPVLILLTTGRKSGNRISTPLFYLRDGDGYAVAASNGGSAGHPSWWLNLGADPLAAVEVDGSRIRVHAGELEGREKRRLWEGLVEMYPPYADYQKRTDRGIPVILLKPIS